MNYVAVETGVKNIGQGLNREFGKLIGSAANFKYSNLPDGGLNTRDLGPAEPKFQVNIRWKYFNGKK